MSLLLSDLSQNLSESNGAGVGESHIVEKNINSYVSSLKLPGGAGAAPFFALLHLGLRLELDRERKMLRLSR